MNQMTQVNFKLDQEIKDLMQKQAKKLALSTSAYLRVLVLKDGKNENERV